jgi:hypothetical protein
VGSGRRIHAPWPRIRCSGVWIRVLLLRIRRPPLAVAQDEVDGGGSGSVESLARPTSPRTSCSVAAARASSWRRRKLRLGGWIRLPHARFCRPYLSPYPDALGRWRGWRWLRPHRPPSILLHHRRIPSSPTSTRTTLNYRGRIGASWVSICLLLIGHPRGGGLWASLTLSGWSCSVAGHTVRLLACRQWGSVPFAFVQGPTAARLRGLAAGLLAAGFRIRGRLPVFSSGRHNAVWSPRRRRPRQPRG